MKLLRTAACACLATLTLAPVARAQENPLVKVMREELARSMSGLRGANQPAPYYIAYSIDAVVSMRVNATLGAIVSNQPFKSRLVRVEVRVGDYARDSSRFLSFDFDPGISMMYSMG